MAVRLNQLMIVAIFFLFAYWVQYSMGMHGDVAYLIEIAHAITKGKKYGIDFFETNPPMILYLYLPVWLLTKMTLISIADSLKVYIFSITFFSLILSYFLLKKIITNHLVLSVFLTAILFVTLIFPANQFGQREHLLIILILPYLFAAVLRLDDHDLPWFYAVSIGLLAALGFGIKPYFLYPLILIELYFVIKKRFLFGWVRIESLIILMILTMYLISTVIFYPTYFSTIMPLVNQFYFIGISESLLDMAVDPFLLFCLSVFFSYFFISESKKNYFHLKRILILTLLGFILSLLTTRTTWFYHIMPAVSIACLLLALNYGELANAWFSSSQQHAFFNTLLFLLTGLIIFFIPVYYTTERIAYYIQDTKRGDLTKLTHYLASQSGKHSVMCFSATTTGDCFPLTIDTQSIYGSRYPFFWWMRGLMMVLNNNQAMQQDKIRYKNYFSESIANELNEFAVRFVIINTHSAHYTFGNHFSYITFFSSNPIFRKTWSQYSLKKRIGIYEIYERSSKATEETRK